MLLDVRVKVVNKPDSALLKTYVGVEAEDLVSKFKNKGTEQRW